MDAQARIEVLGVAGCGHPRATADIAETDESHVQVYIVDVPARQIAEWGQLLPLPGEEAAWDAALPDAVKRRMAQLLG